MNSQFQCYLADEEATKAIAVVFASCLHAPLIVTFSGQIGAGKTTFIRAMLRELGVDSAIKSPTFSIVENYSTTNAQINHFDLYRISSIDELNYIGFRDYFEENAICCIEWPEKAGIYLENVDLGFTLALKGNGRELIATSYTSNGEKILSCFKEKWNI
ncbi:ATPase or kinase (plasmid) [Legionella adelaidensis]|uniref:tRNA threonylcarbamoyladenosine biosynthesis protein TsaE n=1 Tax=Legionella adelaidensis TaxID=45056 RepID=A0A0W0R0D9_9GAMM|nr:tRNA (adenosine(37)-N6)-threonylcarbamoyltransferase complex ATPase subunit type 1 TsaE [Legionella adelaidensis]KTC64520.1 ATPase or kinase [Legionella adelaidensis]VEH85888.1 ATPase or kinase [Legionella adelaidensis]